MAGAQPITLRPAVDGDRFLIRRWLGEPHVIAWWGSRASAEAAIAVASESVSAIRCVIEAAGQPIGYAQAVDVGIWGTPPIDALPAGSFEAAMFIGSSAHRGKGYGAIALTQLRDEVFATTLAPSLGIKVSIKNERAVRVIEKAGFLWRAVIQDPLIGPVWLLRKDRYR